MHILLVELYKKFKIFNGADDGQNLAEYALLLALVGLASIAGTHSIASAAADVLAKLNSLLLIEPTAI
jgi:Flp pilus assembly pilin Flp